MPDPDRIVHVFSTREGRESLNLIAFPDYLYFRQRAQGFEDLAAHYASAPINFASAGESKEVNGPVVTSNYFRLLGLEPAAGRFFTDSEDQAPRRDAVAVIGYDWWRRQFDANPAVVGQSIRLNGTAFTIVGVAPREFRGVLPGGLAVDVWMPSAMFAVGYRYYCDVVRDRRCRVTSLVGRLKHGYTRASAQAELDVLAYQMEAAYPETNTGWRIVVVPGRGLPVGSDAGARTPLLLAAAAGLVLLITCANVAGLFLTRAIGRRRELAVRTAIGANRRRLARQLLTESVLLAAAGGIGALLVMIWAKDILLTFYLSTSEGQRANFALEPDRFVFAFTGVASLAPGVAFGLLPAIQGTRADLLAALKDDLAGGPMRSRLRDALVVAQIAVSLVLLVGAGLVTRSLISIYRGPGFDPSHVALLRLRPSLIARSPAAAKAYHEAVIRRLEAVPGVLSASPAAYPPLPGWDAHTVAVWRPDQLPPGDDAALRASWNRVGPRFFETIGVSFVEGRGFDASDRQGAPAAAIVNETLARRLWPGESPVVAHA